MERFKPESEAENIARSTSESKERRGVREVVRRERQFLQPPAEKGTSERTAKGRRWKEAVFYALTFMALSGAVDMGLKDRLKVQMGDRAATTLIEKANPNGESNEKENKAKVEKLRSQIKNSKLKEEIFYLATTYGDVIEQPLFDDVEKAESAVDTLAKATSDAERHHLEAEAAQEYDWFWNKDAIVRRAEARHTGPAISGFQNLEGATNQEVREILKSFPREMLANIDSIRYYPVVKAAVNYGVAGQAEDVGVRGVISHEDGNNISIYHYEGIENNQAEMKRVLIHETAHENDWQAGNRLTVDERVEFFKDITELLLDGERPTSQYVDEKIPAEYKTNGWDMRAMKYRQARELWAVTVEQYFTDPAALGSDSIKGYQLVEKWISRITGQSDHGGASKGSSEEVR